MRNQKKSCTHLAKIPLKSEESRTLNIQVISPRIRAQRKGHRTQARIIKKSKKIVRAKIFHLYIL